MSSVSDFVIENGVLKEYKGAGGDVVIPEGVTSIGTHAFKGCQRITGVTIPPGVVSIEAAAFEERENLKRVVIPQGVTSIGYCAFNNCKSLETITIPEGVKTIGERAFHSCRSLRNILIPEGVTTIGSSAFRKCGNLTVSLPETLKETRPAFTECICTLRLKRWTPEITKLMNGSRIVAVCIEDFQSLPPAYRPSTAARMITDGSFDPSSDSGKECIAYLKKNVGKLHEIAMRDIKVLYSLCEYHLISARDFDLFMQEAEKSDNIELKSMLLDYQNQLGLDALTNVREKREKVKADYQDALVDRIGTCAPKGGIKGLTFAVTGKLEQWTSRETIREWLELHGANLGSCVSRKSDYLVSNSSTGSTREKNKAMELGVSVIDETAFNGMVCWRYQCGETITVPGWVRRIPADAFTENCKDGWNCTKSVVISEGVTHISDCAFNQCYNLKNVKIPTSVVSIGERAFASCSGLARVTIPGKLETVGKGAFHNCGHIDFICDDPNTLALLIEKDFEIEDSVLKKYNGPGGNVTIPKNVTEIGGSAFYNCYLTNVIIPESVIRIGDYAFRYCGSMSSVTIPESVTRIGFFSFENCPNLTIHAPAGSYAEQYAKENKIPFVAK